MMMWLGIVWKVRISEDMRKKRTWQGGFFIKIVGGAIGTCGRKTTGFILDITQILIVVLDYFQQNMELCYNFESCFQ